MVIPNEENMAVEDVYFGEDNRFQLDERFDGEFSEKPKKKKLPEETSKKKKGQSFENKVIVRYDPTLPDHKKFELKSEKDRKRALQHASTKKSEKKRKKKEKLSRVEAAPQPVSEQTFVKISNDLKGYFQKKEKKTEGFSILKMLKENESSDSNEVETEELVNKQKPTQDSSTAKHMQLSEKETKPEILNIERLNLDKGTKTIYKENEKQDRAAVNRREYYNPKKGKIYCPENGVWYDTLFPKKGDMRLEEGIKWLNTRPQLPENWAKFRREVFFDALQKQQKSFKKLNSLKNPHQQRREHQLNKARKYIHRSIQIKRGK